jgi:hypothetical protein
MPNTAQTKVMQYKGFNAQIMEAPRLVGEQVFDLPPGAPLDVYPADAFVNYPSQWMCGAGVFIVPVRPNKGLWFNWTLNDALNMAVLPTVKGCNPITGMQTSGFHLERYEKKCPKHGVDFQGNRYCPDCGYKWPDRNFVSMSPSWWDGFRTEDGTVRQFFFTEDELRDVATQLIGKDQTVPAFGFAFYRPKEPRAVPASTYRAISSYGCKGTQGTPGPVGERGDPGWPGIEYYTSHSVLGGKFKGDSVIGGTTPWACSTQNPINNELCYAYSSNSDNSIGKTAFRSATRFSEEVRAAAPKKDVAIGAGAKIAQELQPDPYALDSWKDTPDAVMTIYFVFQEKFEELKAGGMRDLVGHKEGMLVGIPVG